MTREIVVYSRPDCHLCHQAEAVLAAHGLRYRVVDVEGDSALRDLYGQCVPVVVIDGAVRFRGKVNPVLLKRLLAPKP